MPKILQTLFDVVPDEALLVRSAYLRNDIKASALMTEARRRAKDLLLQSEQRAEDVYLEAKAEGYIAGIVQAAEAMAQYLSAHAELTTKLQQQLLQEVAELLRHCVSDADVIMAAFEEAVVEQGEMLIQRLEIVMPENMRANHRQLVARLQPHVNGQINIEYWSEARFVLRLGDQVVEFVPDDFVVRASARVMKNLPSIYAQHHTVANRCRQHLAVLFASREQEISGSSEKENRVLPEEMS